jgi:hypothetical protein
MAADSDSNIAWHRAQLKKNREALRDLETGRFTMGEIAGSRRSDRTPGTITDLKRKIRESEQIVAAHEIRAGRPRGTDLQSLASVRWSSWNARSIETPHNGPQLDRRRPPAAQA